MDCICGLSFVYFKVIPFKWISQFQCFGKEVVGQVKVNL